MATQDTYLKAIHDMLVAICDHLDIDIDSPIATAAQAQAEAKDRYDKMKKDARGGAPALARARHLAGQLGSISETDAALDAQDSMEQIALEHEAKLLLADIGAVDTPPLDPSTDGTAPKPPAKAATPKSRAKPKRTTKAKAKAATTKTTAKETS